MAANQPVNMTDGARGKAVTPSLVWRKTTLTWQKTGILTNRILIKLLGRGEKAETLAGFALPASVSPFYPTHYSRKHLCELAEQMLINPSHQIRVQAMLNLISTP